ncbi:hypothetical protein V1514DRAFT_85215 [Lipomyces japonicus]|uniref:uncharacterized protein n=1 Tax=Lipomyces japonicus TaxID=56871 RepID=UPI0034CE843C
MKLNNTKQSTLNWFKRYRMRLVFPLFEQNQLVQRGSPKDLPDWVNTNKEYGISDRELLDEIFTRNYKVKIDLPSKIKTVVQRPDMLTASFQRRFYLRLYNRGLVLDYGGMKILSHCYIASKKNISTPDLLKGVRRESLDTMKFVPKGNFTSRYLGLQYYPPYHIASILAKSSPAVIVFGFNKLARATTRTWLKKKIKNALFMELCDVQGITRETLRWDEISTFEPMDDKMPGLGFLLENQRPTYDQTLNEFDYEFESLLTKRNHLHIQGINGLYYFKIHEDMESPLTIEQITKFVKNAVQFVIGQWGYISKDQFYRVQSKYQDHPQFGKLNEYKSLVTYYSQMLERNLTKAEVTAVSRREKQFCAHTYNTNEKFLTSYHQRKEIGTFSNGSPLNPEEDAYFKLATAEASIYKAQFEKYRKRKRPGVSVK